MAGEHVLGVDSGLTVTKAVAFDADGRALGVGRSEVALLKPRARFVERDMEEHWRATCEAIRGALDAARLPAEAIGAVGITGHGDGLYPVDAAGRPHGRAILSLDSRAAEVVDGWRRDGRLDRALNLIGQRPHPFTPAAVLAWMKRHEPERYRAIGRVLFCKDWLRLRLTGETATDPTEASVAFTDVRTQAYSAEALALFGLEEIEGALPPVKGCAAVAGEVTTEAAEACGLRPGTPVVTGLHDVTATAVGMGGVRPGRLSLVAGTYSINEVISTEPVLDARWFCRNGFRPAEWMNMAISPASSANLDWFVREHGRDALADARRGGGSPFDTLNAEIEAAFAEPSGIVYHPFLYGSPLDDRATAGFLGLQGWHGRGHLLRAVFEGIVFNHRWHADALRSAFPVDEAGLAGGGARNPLLAQLFADTLGLTITIVEAEEVGALGAALCALVGVGRFADLDAAVAATRRELRRHAPDAARGAELDEAYRRYLAVADALTPVWPTLRATDDAV